MFFVSKQYTPRLLRTLIESDAVYAAAVAYLDWRVYGFFFHLRQYCSGPSMSAPPTPAC